MCCCGASLDAGSSSVRLADLCLCAGSPRAVASVSRRPASFAQPRQGRRLLRQPRQQEQELSFRLSAQTLPLQSENPAHICRMACRTHVQPATRSWHTGRPTRRPDSAVRRRAATPRSPSAQHRAALSSTSARRDDSLSSHPITRQTPAQRRTPARISRSDPAALSRVPDTQPETVPTRWSVAASRAVWSLTVTSI